MTKRIASLMIGCIVSLTLGPIILPLAPLQASPLKVSTGRILYSDPSPGRTHRVDGNRTGGSKKGSCYATKPLLTALVPEKPDQDNPQQRNAWGKTTAERPTLWFYVPYVLKDGMDVEFLLEDSNGKSLVERPIPVQLPEAPGIIRVNFPASVPLQVDQFYRWTLNVKCDNPGMSVYGWIQRVDLSSSAKQQLAAAQGLQKAAVYAENGIWFDALTALADNRSGASFTENWTDLLRQIGLENIAQQQFVQ